MSAFLGQAAGIIGGVLMTMAGQLLTEKFLKKLIVQALEAVVKKTETKEDDRVLEEAKKAWGL